MHALRRLFTRRVGVRTTRRTHAQYLRRVVLFRRGHSVFRSLFPFSPFFLYLSLPFSRVRTRSPSLLRARTFSRSKITLFLRSNIRSTPFHDNTTPLAFASSRVLSYGSARARKRMTRKMRRVPFETPGKKENFNCFFFHFSPKNRFLREKTSCFKSFGNTTSSRFCFPFLFLL